MIATDKRYTIDMEYCGYPVQRHVVRFCGDWVGSEPTQEQAERTANLHNQKRIGVL